MPVTLLGEMLLPKRTTRSLELLCRCNSLLPGGKDLEQTVLELHELDTRSITSLE